jgi:hypothetical protein
MYSEYTTYFIGASKFYGPWCVFTCIFPRTTISGKRYFLKKIFRREVFVKPLMISYYEYGDIFDTLKL